MRGRPPDLARFWGGAALLPLPCPAPRSGPARARVGPRYYRRRPCTTQAPHGPRYYGSAPRAALARHGSGAGARCYRLRSPHRSGPARARGGGALLPAPALHHPGPARARATTVPRLAPPWPRKGPGRGRARARCGAAQGPGAGPRCHRLRPCTALAPQGPGGGAALPPASAVHCSGLARVWGGAALLPVPRPAPPWPGTSAGWGRAATGSAPRTALARHGPGVKERTPGRSCGPALYRSGWRGLC
ncbi:hypothetical protein HNP84_004548 [Thermocatellispora tengchongensis]|uniref:Uncharacterized protein n=1 Tax=Thermocatellispora tengchongensis TaxID=1073253 RepID=A0A840P0Q7_9ACTN|nr:hypothetical protein [Thermocatellispora tengchongensis]